MGLSSEAVIGISIGAGILALNLCIGVTWFLVHRRAQSPIKHTEEVDTSLISGWQAKSHAVPPTSPTSPASPTGVRQSYQSLLMALKIQSPTRLSTPATEKSAALKEPLMPFTFFCEPTSPVYPRRSTQSTPPTSDSSVPPTPELPPAPAPAGALGAEAVMMPQINAPKPALAAPQFQYPFLAEPTPLPSRPPSRVWRMPTKKSAKSARSSLRRRGSWDTASMYSVASAPMSQHDALLMASLDDLANAPPSSAPAWLRYDEGRVMNDLEGIAEMSMDGSMHSQTRSPTQPAVQLATTPLPSPPQPSLPSVRRPSVRALPSPPVQYTSFSSNASSPVSEGHPNAPPGLYTVVEDPGTSVLLPSLSRAIPPRISSGHLLPPQLRAHSINDVCITLAPDTRPTSDHALPALPVSATSQRPLSVPEPSPAVPARSPFRRIDELPQNLLAGPHASRPISNIQ